MLSSPLLLRFGNRSHRVTFFLAYPPPLYRIYVHYKFITLYGNIVLQYKEKVKEIIHLKNLVKLRGGRGWSREKLAVESGVSYNTIVKIEYGGIENPKIETVIKLAKALGISIDKLVGK